ncbi:branched-chain amino acid ABC transporter permease [Neobacillus sp. SAB-20_R2A]|uniref:branched-chain amino acid ABC transporter permease n=1 Tax=Neobacillus sp. SAB-20_R2A TaxID=3120519 RepID=UPI003C6DE380
MDSIIQLLVNSLQTGAIYVIFALGLTLVFGVMKIVNFAHGEFYTAGAFLTYLFIDQWGFLANLNSYLAYFIAFIFSILIVGIVGYFVELAIFSRFHGDMISGLIISLGLSMVLQVVYLMLFSANPKNVTSIFEGTSNLFGGVISNERIAIFILALLFTIGMSLIIKKTRFGKAMRAISQDKEAAELQGIKYKSITRWGFVVGVILAASAGVLVSPASIVDPYIGGAYLMKAFIIIILGGMGSIPGCIIAGFILGVIESFGTFYFDLAFATTLSFVLVMVMLIIRPQGLMGNVSK